MSRPAIPLLALVLSVAFGSACNRQQQPDTSSRRADAQAPQPASPALPDSSIPGQPPSPSPQDESAVPPLPLAGTPLPRPIEDVRAAYRFAAEHPEILRYVPCFCGCERAGHRGNEDCFVRARDRQGRVIAWDTHGLT